MLAKWWKKIALAICIIAILFNITHKLVARTSLKDELRSVLGGNAISFSVDDSETSNKTENKNSVNNNTNKVYENTENIEENDVKPIIVEK